MSNLSPIILASAQRWDVDPALVGSVVHEESRGNPSAWNKEGGGQGAAGAMQVRQGALADYNAANGTNYSMQDLTKPEVGIDVGSWYLSKQLDRFNDPAKALIAYNEGAGSPNVAKGSSPYAQSILGRLNMPKQQTQTLPGIPVSAPQGNMSDDAIFSAFTKGANPAQQASQQGPSDDQILAAFTRSAPAAQQAVPAQQPAAPAAQSPADQPGSVMSFLAGVGRGVQETALGAQQLVGHGLQAAGSIGQSPAPSNLVTGQQPQNIVQRAGNWLVNDANQGLARGAQEVAPYSAAHPLVTGAGNIAGSIAATAPLSAIGPAVRGLGTAAVRGGISGALTSLTAPVDPNSQNYWQDKASQEAIGTATGGVLGPLAYGVGRLISPNVSSDIKTLMNKGVTPTPGQILGGGFATTEDKLTSIPVLGDVIKNAQQRSVQQFNTAAYNEALAPIGQTVSADKIGQEGVEAVKNAISDTYDRVLPQMKFQVDPQFQSDITNLGNLAQNLPDAQANTFMKVLKTQIFGKMSPQGYMDGDTLKGVQSELARKANGYLGSGSFDDRELGAAISEIRSAVDDNLSRVNPPDLSQDLANANSAWARFTRLRSAASSQGAANNEGVFTAAMLSRAVRSGDQSVGKGATATGNALMQDLAGAGQRVLGSKYPDSGTVGRGLLSLLAPTGIAAGFATQPVATAATLGGIGLGSLPYTALGQRAMATLLTARPQFAQPVGNAVARLGPGVVSGSLPALLSGSR